LDGGHTTIRVDGQERLLLEVFEADSLNLMRNIEKAEDHGNLGGVGPGLAVDLDGLNSR